MNDPHDAQHVTEVGVDNRSTTLTDEEIETRVLDTTPRASVDDDSDAGDPGDSGDDSGDAGDDAGDDADPGDTGDDSGDDSGGSDA